MSRCQAKTAAGKQCSYSAKEGKDYCGIHLNSSKVGRPKALQDIDLELLTRLCKLGLTDEQLADFYEVSVATIYNAKNRDQEFLEAIKKGKEIADAAVGEALYQRATGYEHEAVKIQQYEGQIIETPYIKHYAPDTTAAIFWLKNRRRDDWRDSKNIDVQSKGEKVKGINFNIVEGKDPSEIYGEQPE